MGQEMTCQNPALSAPVNVAEPCLPCYCLPPLAAAIIARKREMGNLPPVEPPQVEICLSPLLWSESFGLLVDG